MKSWSPCLLLLLAACDLLPRDPAGTMQAVERQGRIRVGIVADPTGLGRDAMARLVRALSDRTGARPHIVSGASEPLLQALDRGDIDMVIAPFDGKTPWAMLVSLSPPIAAKGSGKDRIDIRAAMRNGENRWIMAVEKAARAVADPGAGS